MRLRLHHKMRLSIIAFALLLPVFGQPVGQPQDTPPPSSEKPLIVEKFTFVVAPVTVTDKSGNLINGLRANDFQLFDNDNPQRITQDIAFHPISLVIAVQGSANMEGLIPKIQRLGSVLDDLVLGEQGEAAVIKYDHRIQTLQSFTSEPNKISEAMKKLKPGSSSNAMNDAVSAGLRMLKTRGPERRKVLLIIGEARDSGSEARLREVATEVQFANAVIYSIDVGHLMATLTSKPQPPRPSAIPPEAQHLPAGVQATPTTQAQNNVGNWIPAFVEIFRSVKGVFVDNPAQVYTRFSGGREYAFASQRALEQAVSDLGRELHSQYLLTYAPTNIEQGGFHDIRVVVNRPELIIRTRPGYWIAGTK